MFQEEVSRYGAHQFPHHIKKSVLSVICFYRGSVVSGRKGLRLRKEVNEKES